MNHPMTREVCRIVDTIHEYLKFKKEEKQQQEERKQYQTLYVRSVCRNFEYDTFI